MIIFRTDASPLIGFGHLTRCRALALALRQKGQRCVMVGPGIEYAESGDRDIFEDWVPVSGWLSSQEDTSRVISLARQHQAEWLVLDDYRIDDAYQLALHAAGLRWLQFDGRADKSLWADIVVNASPIAKTLEYSNRIRKPNARLLLGEQYSIIRSECFTDSIRKQGYALNSNNVVICFGGGDDRGAVAFILQSLINDFFDSAMFTILAGGSNPQITEITSIISSSGMNSFDLRINTEEFSSILQSARVAIISGGTLVYESAFLGVPSLVIRIAENQLASDTAYSAYAGDFFRNFSGQHFVGVFHEIFNNPSRLAEMSSNGLAAVDGLGAQRISSSILNYLFAH